MIYLTLERTENVTRCDCLYFKKRLPQNNLQQLWCVCIFHIGAFESEAADLCFFGAGGRIKLKTKLEALCRPTFGPHEQLEDMCGSWSKKKQFFVVIFFARFAPKSRERSLFPIDVWNFPWITQKAQPQPSTKETNKTDERQKHPFLFGCCWMAQVSVVRAVGWRCRKSTGYKIAS